MSLEAIKNRVGWLVGLNLLSVTVIVTPNWTLDPINIPKMWLLTIFSMAILALLISQFKIILNHKYVIFTIFSFSLPFWMAISLIFSDSILSQQLFGTYGRNTGLLTYVGLSIVFLGTSIATNRSSTKPVMVGAIGAITINAVYGFLQAIGKDWNTWAAAYSPVFGTLGNPDFISAFLGFTSSFAFAFLLARQSSLRIKLLSILYLPIALFVIYKSKAQQGFLVFCLVALIVLFFELKNHFKSNMIQAAYLLFFGISGFLAIAGSLQKGPLADLLYRYSITQRGDYWHAAINMFWKNPFTGVGLDSYGDWYRFFRTEDAAARFEGAVVTNTAHNVFLDIASTSGLLALISYLAIIFLALRSSWRIYKRNSNLEPIFIGVFAAWAGYLAQSVISINNIGLAIWGWTLPGWLIAMERWQTEDKETKQTKQTKQESRKIDFSGMFMTAGLTIGLVVGFFPYNADANFRHSLEEGNPDKIYLAANKWPTDSSRYLYAAKIFQSNNLNEKAESLIRKSLKENPRSFENWQFLYQLSSISEKEKASILLKLEKLDPNNKNIK